MPLRAHASAVTCAANGVDLREPLNPAEPADSQAMTLPSLSVRATIVLLNDRLDVRLADGDVLADAAARATACGRLSARRSHR